MGWLMRLDNNEALLDMYLPSESIMVKSQEKQEGNTQFEGKYPTRNWIWTLASQCGLVCE